MGWTDLFPGIASFFKTPELSRRAAVGRRNDDDQLSAVIKNAALHFNGRHGLTGAQGEQPREQENVVFVHLANIGKVDFLAIIGTLP